MSLTVLGALVWRSLPIQRFTVLSEISPVFSSASSESNESRILRVFCKVPSLIVPWLIARYSASSFLKMLLNSFMTKTTFLPENRQMYLLLPVQGVRSPEAAQCPDWHKNGWHFGLYVQEFFLRLHKGCCH